MAKPTYAAWRVEDIPRHRGGTREPICFDKRYATHEHEYVEVKCRRCRRPVWQSATTVRTHIPICWQHV